MLLKLHHTNENIVRHTARTILSRANIKTMAYDSYFRFDYDEMMKAHIFLQSSEGKRASLKHRSSYIASNIIERFDLILNTHSTEYTCMSILYVEYLKISLHAS